MKLQSFNCPNCKAPLEQKEDSPLLFCPYCGTKIASGDIEFYKEDSKTARVHTIANAVKEVIGTKEQREEERKAKRKEAEEAAIEARKNLPLEICILVAAVVLLILAKHFGW